MLNKYLEFSFAYAILIFVQLFLEFDPYTAKLVLGNFMYGIKPMITISLMIFFIYRTKLTGRFAKRIFIGLLMGLIGDSLLMVADINQMFFMYGLFAFLLGHIAYISAFYLDYKRSKSLFKNITILATLIFAAYCAVYLVYLTPFLAEMKIPVYIYSIVILAMTVIGISRYGTVGAVSFNLILVGVILFLISDSILGINKFAYSFDYAGIAIMLPYMLAQYLITIGSIERKLKRQEIIDQIG